MDSLDPWSIPVVSREDWGGTTPLTVTPLTHPLSIIHVTATDTKECRGIRDCCEVLRSQQKLFMENQQYPDLPYNFYISIDGTIYEGSGWTGRASSLDSDERLNYLKIGYIGKFDETSSSSQTGFMQMASADLLKYGQHKGYIVEETKVIYMKSSLEEKQATKPYQDEHYFANANSFDPF